MKFLTALLSLHVTLPVAMGAVTNAVYLPTKSIPESLTPNRLNHAIDNFIFRQLTEGLFDVGDGFRIEPKLAAATTWSGDGLVLTVHLRRANLSDGSQISADQVSKSVLRCVKNSPKTLLLAVRSIVGYDDFVRGKRPALEGLKVVDESTIEFRLSRPSPLLIDELAQVECHVIKAGRDGSLDLMSGAIGSGPYVLERHDKKELSLVKNPNYYQANNGPGLVIYRRTDSYGDFSKLSSWATMVPLAAPPKAKLDFDMIESSELGTNQLVLNNSCEPFKKQSLRQAVALGIDYFGLAQRMGWEPARVQAGMIPFGMRGFQPRVHESLWTDRNRARQILSNLGYSKSKPFVFTILLPAFADTKAESSIWSTAFGDLPIEVKTEILSYEQYLKRHDAADFQAIRLIKYPGSVEPHRLLASYLSESTYNDTHSYQPICDELTQQALATLNRDERFKQYAKAERCLIDAAILVPLSSLQASFIMLKQPWHLRRTNKYLLYPYWVSEWLREGQ